MACHPHADEVVVIELVEVSAQLFWKREVLTRLRRRAPLWGGRVGCQQWQSDLYPPLIDESLDLYQGLYFRIECH